MKWFWLIIILITAINAPFWGALLAVIYWIFWLANKPNDTVIPTTDNRQLSTGDLADLVLLRLELQNQFKAGAISNERYKKLIEHIDTLSQQYIVAVPDSPQWQQCRANAWNLLKQSTGESIGIAPWYVEVNDAPPIEIKASVTDEPRKTDIPQLAEAEITQAKPAVFTIDEADHATEPPSWTTNKTHSIKSEKTTKKESSLNQYAWKPDEPSYLERALSTLSGWHALAVPFLAQNIGWFIGVFCFIAGSMFLVSYTSGYIKNLIALIAFFIFTLSLLFGGYHLRRTRPELETSSYVIFILSLLLIPLTTITATQLLISSDGLGLQIISGLLIIAAFTAFYVLVTLVSGLMDRSLQQGLPKFFLALTATQLLQVSLSIFPFWQLLAVIHILIFTLLSAGIYRFVSQWLQAIFVDQQKITYFAAGTLIYAAVVSFVFVTTGNHTALPDGYYGVFLMLLCGLLFFVDVQLQQWIEKHAALSRFSFLVYALSVLALVLAAGYQTATVLTLLLAIALYAFIVWNYLTLTPLTILLACYFWLYHVLVLRHFADAWYLLLSLPVLFSLYALANWAINKRKSAHLAVIVYRGLYALLIGLTLWSLGNSDAGLAAMLTALTATALTYITLKATPIVIFTPYSKINPVDLTKQENLLASRWFYCLPILLAVSVFYAPPFVLLGEAQFSLGLLVLAVAWLGLYKVGDAHPTNIEHTINSTLFSLLLSSLPLWFFIEPMHSVLPFLVMTVLLFYLSYQLLARGLFYVGLVTIALAFMPIKAVYFPAPSGLVTMIMAIGLWFWLWYCQRPENDILQLRREQREQQNALSPSFRLLGFYQLPSTATLFRDVINTPLEQVMCLFWLLGMKTLFSRYFANQLSYAWLVAVLLMGVFSLLLIIRYRWIKLLPIPIAVLLASVLLLLQSLQLSTASLLLASVLFALLVWQWLRYSITRPVFIKLSDALNPFLLNDHHSIVRVTHITSFFIVVSAAVLQLLTATHSVTALLTFAITTGFLWLSDRANPLLAVRYLVLGFAVVTGIELVSLSIHVFVWQSLSSDPFAALLFALSSLALATLSMANSNYDRPATITALSFALYAVLLQLSAFNLITPLDYAVLFIVGGGLLLANVKTRWAFVNFIAFAILLLATLWLEYGLFHANQPFSLWLGEQTPADVWLLLGLLCFALSLLAHRLLRSEQWSTVYGVPLNTVTNLAFVWQLLATLSLFIIRNGQAPLLPLLLALALLNVFSLSRHWYGAAHYRGLASAILSSLFVFSVLPAGFDDGYSLQVATVLWAYGLWLFASFVLPYINTYYKAWTIEAVYFPYLGFLLVLVSCVWQTFSQVHAGIYGLELSLYCVLMLRYSTWVGFAWLSALAFSAAGIAFNFDDESLPLNLLLWSNVQLLLVQLWRYLEKTFAKARTLITSYTWLVQLVLYGYLLLASLWFFIDIADQAIKADLVFAHILVVALLLVLSFMHLLWLRFSALALHGFIYAVFLLLWFNYRLYLSEFFQPPLLLALWSFGLWLIERASYKLIADSANKFAPTLYAWLRFSVIVATLALFSYSTNNLGEALLALAIITSITAQLAWRSDGNGWLLLAGLEALILLHSWAFLLVGYQIIALLPWYTLQASLLASVGYALLNIRKNATYTLATLSLLVLSVRTLLTLSLLELMLHGIIFSNAVLTGVSIQWLLAPFDMLAALSSGLIISLMGLHHTRHTPNSNWLYGIVTLIGALLFYVRLLWLGAAVVGVWDTAALIAFAYSLFFLHRLFPAKPLLNMALFMPVLALFTVPLQLASIETTITLMLSSVLYALVRRHSQQKIPLYLALLAFNASVYLWVPQWADNSRLIQIYVIPAALSLLLLLQLHHRELKPSVLMGSRLAAISTIYACATVDVFLRAELGIFILAMALSIAGILLGIALRTRAFLYAGVSFLLLNVIGQLLRFYPEQMLGKAIVLMAMGFVILGLMFWFNIKRVAILQRINMIQAEMKTWQ
jgi:hypothetical protein